MVMAIAAAQISCNHSGSKYEKETQFFSDYIKQHFNKSIGTQKTYYYLVSETGCSGCISDVLNSAFADHRNNIMIMSKNTVRRFFSEKLTDDSIWLDNTDQINRLPYHKGNIALVVTDNSRIDTIISFESSILGDQLRCVKN